MADAASGHAQFAPALASALASDQAFAAAVGSGVSSFAENASGMPIASTRQVSDDLVDLIRRNRDLIEANDIKLREAGKSVNMAEIRVPPETVKTWENFQARATGRAPVYHRSQLAPWDETGEH